MLVFNLMRQNIVGFTNNLNFELSDDYYNNLREKLKEGGAIHKYLFFNDWVISESFDPKGPLAQVASTEPTQTLHTYISKETNRLYVNFPFYCLL